MATKGGVSRCRWEEEEEDKDDEGEEDFKFPDFKFTTLVAFCYHQFVAKLELIKYTPRPCREVLE